MTAGPHDPVSAAIEGISTELSRLRALVTVAGYFFLDAPKIAHGVTRLPTAVRSSMHRHDMMLRWLKSSDPFGWFDHVTKSCDRLAELEMSHLSRASTAGMIGTLLSVLTAFSLMLPVLFAVAGGDYGSPLMWTCMAIAASFPFAQRYADRCISARAASIHRRIEEAARSIPQIAYESLSAGTETGR